MSEQNGKIEPGTPTQLQVVKGGQEIDVKFLDGSSGQVKVRLPNIRDLELYEDLQADEASLVELFVGELDKDALYQARRLYRERASLNELRIKTATLKERQEIDAEMSKLDVKILELQRSERFDDKLNSESHDEIYDLGKQLWGPRYERWEKNTLAANARMRERIEKVAADMVKARSATAKPSATSSPSVASS